MYLLHPRNYFSREKREKRRYIFNLYFTPTIITQGKKRIGKIIGRLFLKLCSNRFRILKFYYYKLSYELNNIIFHSKYY